jgi:hypothetical protein
MDGVDGFAGRRMGGEAGNTDPVRPREKPQQLAAGIAGRTNNTTLHGLSTFFILHKYTVLCIIMQVQNARRNNAP